MQYNIFDESVSRRLAFVMSIMHSYAHQHECQLINNPWYRLGIGLLDGEGTERVWSQMMGLVGIERNLSICSDFPVTLVLKAHSLNDRGIAVFLCLTVV